MPNPAGYGSVSSWLTVAHNGRQLLTAFGKAGPTTGPARPGSRPRR